MRYYEISLLVSSGLSEEELKAFQEKIISLIREKEGILVAAGDFTKEKTVTYPIGKNNRAYLINLSFRFQPEKLGALEEKIKDNQAVLRHMILTKKKQKSAELRRVARIHPADKVHKRKTGEVKKKVELNEIEKKLEEILGE